MTWVIPLLPWLVIIIVLVTLGLMLTRPRGIAEGWYATLGALCMVATGAISPDAVPGLIRETDNVLLFLAGMLLLTGMAERSGVFDLLADVCLRLARGHGVVLFVNLYLLAAIVTTTLSLDVTVIMLTPILYALTSRRRIDPLPFLFACCFVANTGSLALPISNLTNLLVFDHLGLAFGDFAQMMWWPNAIATLTNLAIFLIVFRNRIPRRFASSDIDDVAPIPRDGWLVTCGAVLTITLAAVSTLGLMSRPLWWASITGSLVLIALAILTGRFRFQRTVSDLAPSLFFFVVSMTIMVDAFERTWLHDRMIPLPGSLVPALGLGIGASALGSNVVNNVPMTVLALSLIDRAPAGVREAIAYGTLVGANIGPALTTYGSLATVLWLTQLRRRGIHISTVEYMRISLVTVPPLLIVTGATLFLVLR
jgi:arsenical pump membrane protein